MKSWRSWKKNTRFLVLVVLLSAILITTYAVSNFILYRSRAAAASVFFSPSPMNLPPNSTLKVMIDTTDNYEVVFGWIIINFDNSLVNLTGEITPNPAFANVVSVTSMAEANTTGRIEVALGLSPNDPFQTGIIEWAQIPLTSITAQSTTTQFTVDLANSQLVDTTGGTANNVPLTSTNGQIILNQVSVSPTPTTTQPTPTTTQPTPTTPPVGDLDLEPVADAYVSGNWTTSNFGRSQTLSIDNSPEIKITYLKFDLSSVPSGSSFSNAKLRFSIKDLPGSGSVNTQNINLTDNTWAENTITYANRPAPGIPVTTLNGGQDGTFIEADVTQAVLSRLGQVISFVIDTQGDDGLEFYSKEFPNASRRPHLILSSGPAPTIGPSPTIQPTSPPYSSPTGPLEPADTTLSIAPSTLTVGLNTTFTLDMNINTGINSVVGTEVYLTYDQTKLQLLDIVPGSFLTSPVETLKIIDNNNGTLTHVLHIPPDATAVRGVGQLAVMSFNATSLGTATIQFSPGTIVGAINTGAKNALKSTSGATITIAALSIPGDINVYDPQTGICGDGVVNILDYTVLFENFAEAPTDHPCADINDDGRVNILDYVILFENYGRTTP